MYFLLRFIEKNINLYKTILEELKKDNVNIKQTYHKKK